MIDPFKEFNIDYDGVEYEGLDEKIKKKYDNSVQLYDRIINSIYTTYPKLPKDIKRLETLDFIDFIKENGTEIKFDAKNLGNLESQCLKLEKYTTLLKDTLIKKETLDKMFTLIETTGSRLLYSCEAHKRTSGYTESAINTVEYQSEKSTPINIGNQKLQKTGKIKYTNWTTVFESFVNRYMIINEDSSINYVCANIHEEQFKDPKFVSFLNKVMFNRDYMNYAIKYNGGYLGEPEKTADGNYRLVFDNEDMAAVKKHEKFKQTNPKDDRIK